MCFYQTMKMETIDNIRCLTQDEITGIMSVNVLRHAVQRGITRRVRRASYGRPALYDIDTLPMPYRAEAYRRWPDHEATQRGSVILGARPARHRSLGILLGLLCRWRQRGTRRHDTPATAGC